MTLKRLTLMAALLAAGSAHAAYTSSTTYADIFGATTPTEGFGTNSAINGVSFTNEGTYSAIKDVTTGVASGVFSDVVATAQYADEHVSTVFTFANAITAFGANWSPYFKNFNGATGTDGSFPGAGLAIDLGNDNSVDFVIPTNYNGKFVGYTSDTAFSQFKVSYDNASPWRESYQMTNLQFTAAVPEPETYAMLLAGLALLGVARKRQVSQTR